MKMLEEHTFWDGRYRCCLQTNKFSVTDSAVSPQQVYFHIPGIPDSLLFHTLHTGNKLLKCVCLYLFRVCPKREGYADESQQLFSASAPPASLSLLGNFEVYHNWDPPRNMSLSSSHFWEALHPWTQVSQRQSTSLKQECRLASVQQPVWMSDFAFFSPFQMTI